MNPRRLLCLMIAGMFALAGASPGARAQQYSVEQPLGSVAQHKPDYLKNAGIEQQLNHALPLSDHFVDETGKPVTLGSYFGQRPVVMALVYFHCGMLCPQVLQGMAHSLSQTGFHAGHEYDLVVTSIDPTDTPAEALAEKNQIVPLLGPDADPTHVHFLTSTAQQPITDLAEATGFHYVRVPGPDGKMDQFAHSSVIMIATPDGRLSKYLFGVDYQSRDVRLALVEASNHKIGSFSDIVLLYCCNYTPSQGRYTVAVLRILGLAGMGSMFAVGLMLYLLNKKPRLAV